MIDLYYIYWFIDLFSFCESWTYIQEHDFPEIQIWTWKSFVLSRLVFRIFCSYPTLCWAA